MRNALWIVSVLTVVASAADKPRIFITESGAAQFKGEAAVADTKGSMAFTSGSTPQGIEVIKSFSKNCPQVVITSNREKADYVVRFDHEDVNPTTAFTKGNKVAIFNRDQDLVYTTTTRLLSPAVKNACTAITARP